MALGALATVLSIRQSGKRSVIDQRPALLGSETDPRDCAEAASMIQLGRVPQCPVLRDTSDPESCLWREGSPRALLTLPQAAWQSWTPPPRPLSLSSRVRLHCLCWLSQPPPALVSL